MLEDVGVAVCTRAYHLEVRANGKVRVTCKGMQCKREQGRLARRTSNVGDKAEGSAECKGDAPCVLCCAGQS